MVLHKAKKIIIITEKIIVKKICTILEECGATGYTFVLAGGKGSRGVRSTSERASVVDDFANVKIEVITTKQETVDKITERVAAEYFNNFSGIIYTEDVEILRPGKF